jgi:hypothetical protein
MEREERDRHDIENRHHTQYEADYDHSEEGARNQDRQPRSQVIALAQSRGGTQAGDGGDDMAITAFPALPPRLRSVAYPKYFKPNIQKHDSRSDPNIWLSTYYVAVKAADGIFDHMVAYFLLVMGDALSLWLNNLQVDIITSWVDLSQAFTSNFEATYNRPGNAFNLERVTMKTNEGLRDYTNWFFENRNTCVGVRDDQVVESYKKGVKDRKIFEKIHESRATTVTALMDVVNKLIDTDTAMVNQFDSDTTCDAGTSGTIGDSSSKLRKRPSEVLVAEGHRPSTFNVDEFNATLDSPCAFHEGATHTVRKCSQFKRVFCTPEDPKRPRGDGDRSSSRRYNNNRRDDRRGRGDDNHRDDRCGDEPQPEDRRNERDLPPPLAAGNPSDPFQQAKRLINMIVGGLKFSVRRRQYCKDKREIHLIHTKPSQPLRWSKQPVTFSRADHWVHILDPGSYPLVVEPIVEGALRPQTLIDGGSGLNIIFVETLKKMDFDFKRMTTCDKPFFGIVPDKAAYFMGRISLPVTFGTEDNFRTEYLSFEVADFKSSYHAILGHTMLARFMAAPHYTYLVLKMSAPNRVLSVYDDLIVSVKCDNEALDITTTNACVDASVSMITEATKVAPSDLTILEQKRTNTTLDTTPATKKYVSA